MEKDEKVNWSSYENVPDGLYEAEITRVEKTTSEFGDVYQVHFRINYQNGQGEQAEIMRPVSPKLSPKSKLYELVGALDGKKPNKTDYPEGIVVGELIGKKCRVMVKNVETDQGTFSRIETFLAITKQE